VGGRDKIHAKPMGTGMIVGGRDRDRAGFRWPGPPRSVPAGWATTGIGIAGGTALLIAGVVRRVNYGKWRNRISGMPMVAPTRAGATIGFVGRF
jgi:hypothetical protein